MEREHRIQHHIRATLPPALSSLPTAVMNKWSGNSKNKMTAKGICPEELSCFNCLQLRCLLRWMWFLVCDTSHTNTTLLKGTPFFEYLPSFPLSPCICLALKKPQAGSSADLLPAAFTNPTAFCCVSGSGSLWRPPLLDFQALCHASSQTFLSKSKTHTSVIPKFVSILVSFCCPPFAVLLRPF